MSRAGSDPSPAAAVPRRRVIDRVPPHSADAGGPESAGERARADLGYAPTTGLEDGLRAELAWVAEREEERVQAVGLAGSG